MSLNNQYITPQKNNKTIIIILFVAFIIGCTFSILAMGLSNDTLIQTHTALLIYVIPGIVITPVTLMIIPLNKANNIVVQIFALAFFNIVIFGGIVLYTFLAINFYKADTAHISIKNINIVEFGRDAKYHIPYANIIYEACSMQFKFPDTPISYDNAIQLHIAKGYYNFDVIEKVALIIR